MTNPTAPTQSPLPLQAPPPVRMTPAGERLLAAASELFYAKGIHAVGVDTIAAAAGTTKKTLYDRFGSKDALVALYLQHRVDRWQRYVQERLAQHPPVAAEMDVEAAVRRVLAIFDALEDWHGQYDRGCAFVNAYAEFANTGHPGLAVVRAEKEWIRAVYTQLAREGGFGGAAVEDLGAQLALVHEGSLIVRSAAGGGDAFDQARAAARVLLLATL
ncbi:TetR/AcrR family transcriptional regulator [Phytoactinopolyspora limicola]|uniref:TetR/AcrR family transcriptional regulator n=1 Tax=Phytoactinopolyspora limicola TaxID=2715536 RepID=UPI001A9C98E3|nr:TetR/AcrR family transcriptional regulator [Phytoactinopolyspora limicola]